MKRGKTDRRIKQTIKELIITAIKRKEIELNINENDSKTLER